jgi:phage terminase large subunit
MTATNPFVAAIAGTGGGKTVGGMVTLLKWMMAKVGYAWLACEPTEEMVERNLLRSGPGRPGLLQLLQYVDPRAAYRKTEGYIESALGTVYLVSAHNPTSMEGVHVAGAWMDEAGLMSKLAFETVSRRVGFLAGQVLLTTTPYNRGWLFKEVFQRWQRGDKDYLVSQFPSVANPKYPKEVMERNRRTMDPARFRMMHEGGFERPEGMIYKQWDDAKHLMDPFAIPGDWPRFGGLDYGFNHPTASVFVAEAPDGIHYVYQEYRASAELMADHHKAMMALGAAAVPAFYDDPAGAQYSAEMRRLGLPLQPASNEVLAGIDTVADLLGTGRLKVFRTCVNWIEEVEGYAWTKDQSGIFTDKPVKVDDDLMDATRYALHSKLKGTRLKLFI